ncbi:uncharacterized protein PHACADRAFT_197543 [Phanerochaete carnosa HHB-10118-sp]|uniref:Uncharacterized protein n=1 Tax=Phanerochaete carnosa (strain HHB-10118-sp) TaxID=650164 RepID=K5VNQ4_PHACS|nr:uncharacterized protein PHACADRAFT_197543 [Phanerochaete carnosa HHB-10118-sp]EKM53113.1 hypothetical protein PHACADRAFT_197543 [Phanerochaete carnosa HHB-10118-sp]
MTRGLNSTEVMGEWQIQAIVAFTPTGAQYAMVLPRGLPFKFAQLIETYGPVFSLKQGTRIVCVVGRYQAAIDTMQKHGAYLADRPISIAAGELASGGKRTLLVGAGDRLQKLRK